MIGPHTVSRCDECDRPASVEVEPDCLLCERCFGILLVALSNSVTSVASLSDVKVPTVVSSAPSPPTVGTAISVSGPSLATGMSGDPANAGGEHEAVTPFSTVRLGKSAALETTSLEAADLNAEKFCMGFSSLNSFSGIGSARETSAMLHPGAVDGSTTKLAGRDSGDRAERRSPNSVSDGAANRSLPSEEIEPSVTSAFVPSEFTTTSDGDRPADVPGIAGAGVFEAEVSALEDGWVCPIRDSTEVVDPFDIPAFLDRRNSATFRVSAASEIISNDISKSISAGV